jgi:hypothetical protein
MPKSLHTLCLFFAVLGTFLFCVTLELTCKFLHEKAPYWDFDEIHIKSLSQVMEK